MITVYRHNRGIVITSPNSRTYMEDHFTCYESDNIDIYAVYDGHGGSNIVDFTETNLYQHLYRDLINAKVNDNIINIIQSTIIKFDQNLYYLYPNDKSGTTINILLRLRDQWYLVNLGDSRSITLCQDGHIVVTKDHKPNNRDEYVRIINSGGFIIRSRINGTLSLSRALGDFDEGTKLMMGRYMGISSPLSPLPDIYPLPTPPIKSVIATDGFWDYIGSDEISDILIWTVQHNKSIDNPIYNMFRKVINDITSKDNVTVITVNVR